MPGNINCRKKVSIQFISSLLILQQKIIQLKQNVQ